MRRCTPADKRAYRKSIALIISLAMLASCLYVGPAFAADYAENDGTDVNTEYTQPDTALKEGATEAAADAADDSGVIPEQDAAGAGENTEVTAPDAAVDAPQTDPGETEQFSIRTMGKWDQKVRVVLVIDGTETTLLKPDSKGRYTFSSTIEKVRASKSIKFLISNPAECPLTYSAQNMASNTGGSFLETETTGYTVNDLNTVQLMSDTVEAAGGEMDEAEPVIGPSGENGEGGDPDPGQEEPAIDPDAVQVTEISVDVNGTGEASIDFTASAGPDYNEAKGTIMIRQTRPTSVMNRSAKVRTKTSAPKSIPKKYKEKYFKIIKKNGNEKFEYAYRTVTGAFELKRASGVSESDYRANQGGGTDGTYSYHALCKKGSKTYAKIIKTRLRDMKVVKVSKDLKLNHANDITYDPVNKRLVVTHNAVKRKRVTFVDPDTLKSLGYKDIKIPATLKGATKSQMSAIKGFACVTYMTGGKYKGNYIGIISGNHNFLVLDRNFKPMEYITVNSKFNGSQIYYQGADNIGDKLYVAVYPRSKSRRDFVVAYDMDGNFKGKISLLKGYETENIFHSGDTMYMTLYRPVTKTWYTPMAVKEKVKLTKEERKLAKPDKKGKKPKYKTVINIVKVQHKTIVKRSYVFQMGKVTL